MSTDATTTRCTSNRTVLVVAITVVLAAVVAQAALGVDLVSSPSAAPWVTFGDTYDQGTGDLTITHECGTGLPNETLSLAVVPATVESGDGVVLTDVDSETTVRVVWEHPETGDSHVLHTWTGE